VLKILVRELLFYTFSLSRIISVYSCKKLIPYFLTFWRIFCVYLCHLFVVSLHFMYCNGSLRSLLAINFIIFKPGMCLVSWNHFDAQTYACVYTPKTIILTSCMILTLYNWLNTFCCFSAPFYGPCHRFHR